MRVFVAALSFLGLVAATPAGAQGFQQACHVRALCAGVQPGGGRIMDCLHDHMSELPPECFEAIGRMRLNRAGGAMAHSAPGDKPPAAGEAPAQGSGPAKSDNPDDQQ
jgi:hypothetical protein